MEFIKLARKLRAIPIAALDPVTRPAGRRTMGTWGPSYDRQPQLEARGRPLHRGRGDRPCHAQAGAIAGVRLDRVGDPPVRNRPVRVVRRALGLYRNTGSTHRAITGDAPPTGDSPQGTVTLTVGVPTGDSHPNCGRLTGCGGF